MGAGEAAGRKEGRRAGAQKGRARERLVEKGLSGHVPLPRSPPALHAAGRCVPGPWAWVLCVEGVLSVLGAPRLWLL